MAFFLLGRDSDTGNLRLLSQELFEDRRVALDTLANLVAQSDVSPDNVEVFVVDLDSAAPVLLVPSAAPAAEPEPAAISSEEVVFLGAAEDFVEIEEPEVAPVIEEEYVSDQTLQVAESEQHIEELVVAEEPAILEETLLEEMPGSNAAWSEAGSELTDALKRAAGTLESEGIVAPESIGPTEPADLPVEPIDETALAEGMLEPAPDPGAWPWGVAAEGEVVAEEPVEVEPEYEDFAAEVVAPDVTPDATPVEYVPDLLEEPAADVEGELVKATTDDESFALSQPLIMGSYRDEEPVADSVPEEVQAEEAEPETQAGLQSEPLADLLSPEPAFDSVGESAESQTCDDCVYVETCPHKDASSPATCGSFQWKAV